MGECDSGHERAERAAGGDGAKRSLLRLLPPRQASQYGGQVRLFANRRVATRRSVGGAGAQCTCFTVVAVYLLYKYSYTVYWQVRSVLALLWAQCTCFASTRTQCTGRCAVYLLYKYSYAVFGGKVRSVLALQALLFANRRVGTRASVGGADAHFTCFTAVVILIPFAIKRQGTPLCIRKGGSKVQMLAQQVVQCAVMTGVCVHTLRQL